jgi:REP element-mobilizing transposase RayT
VIDALGLGRCTCSLRRSDRLVQVLPEANNKECWGRRLWARGFFVASFGVVTDEAIIQYIRSQEISKEDGDFRVDDE